MISKPSSLADWLLVLESRHPLTIDLGLDRVSAVWKALGEPRPAEKLFTVAGTNGKGSTTAYITAMLMALGYRCGSYTSPHLFRYNERIQIQAECVSDSDLIRAFEEIDAARGEISLSYFEFGTLAALLVFSKARLDFAVLEVGLGGRLDATNILDTDCAVITSIGLDHQEYLGFDLESIGAEKAGIIRSGKPFIFGADDPPQSIMQIAGKLGVRPQRLGHEFSVYKGANAYSWVQGSVRIDLPVPRMAGPHQLNNMAVSLAAVAALIPEALQQPDTLSKSLASVSVYGRFQVSTDCPRVWLDVGHNPQAAQAVSAALKGLKLRPRICVLGMLRDKDAVSVANILNHDVQTWYCAGIEGERGQSGSELAQKVLQVAESKRVQSFSNITAAMVRALDDSAANDCILVFGSFHTVAQASAFLSSNC